MDDLVKQAIAKWPNVPSVYGWLSLDRRGNWLIKGERISNPVFTGYINRNYEHDAQGRWFFQNGPQRVFVSLDYAPLVYHLAHEADAGAALRIETHTGKVVQRVDGAWIDDAGVLLLVTEHGPGMIDDRDLERLLPCFTGERGIALTDDAIAAAIERLQDGGTARLRFRYRADTVPVPAIATHDVPVKFGFVQHPVQPAGQPAC